MAPLDAPPRGRRGRREAVAAVGSPCDLGQHSDRAAWLGVVVYLKLLLFFAKNGCTQDWMRRIKTAPLRSTGRRRPLVSP